MLSIKFSSVYVKLQVFRMGVGRVLTWELISI